MEIKKAGAEDIPTIKELAETIWPEAYGGIISLQQIRYMLDLIYGEDALKAQMEKGHRFAFAVHHNIAVGFSSFSKKSDEEPQIFRLHKLYVLPQQNIKGIGSFLLDQVIAESRSAGATQLELNVNKNNTAKIFYEKKGFTVLRDEVLDIGEGFVMDDHVMVKALM